MVSKEGASRWYHVLFVVSTQRCVKSQTWPSIMEANVNSINKEIWPRCSNKNHWYQTAESVNKTSCLLFFAPLCSISFWLKLTFTLFSQIKTRSLSTSTPSYKPLRPPIDLRWNSLLDRNYIQPWRYQRPETVQSNQLLLYLIKHHRFVPRQSRHGHETLSWELWNLRLHSPSLSGTDALSLGNLSPVAISIGPCCSVSNSHEDDESRHSQLSSTT